MRYNILTMSIISRADINHIATLARLELTAEEKEQYAEQLSVVFGFVELLCEVDVSNVVETCQVTGLVDVVRADEPADCDEDIKAKLINAFPERVGRLLKVPGVFE